MHSFKSSLMRIFLHQQLSHFTESHRCLSCHGSINFSRLKEEKEGKNTMLNSNLNYMRECEFLNHS